ncbi:hypothetical protein PINS_up017687 [Pythium insidiosum]|nr:hypothetical protein PINS_up017687 [Pythium insidiosum]
MDDFYNIIKEEIRSDESAQYRIHKAERRESASRVRCELLTERVHAQQLEIDNLRHDNDTLLRMNTIYASYADEQETKYD